MSECDMEYWYKQARRKLKYKSFVMFHAIVPSTYDTWSADDDSSLMVSADEDYAIIFMENGELVILDILDEYSNGTQKYGIDADYDYKWRYKKKQIEIRSDFYEDDWTPAAQFITDAYHEYMLNKSIEREICKGEQ